MEITEDDIIRRQDKHLIGTAEGMEGKNGTEAIFEEIKTENFPKFMNNMNPHIQEV